MTKEEPVFRLKNFVAKNVWVFLSLFLLIFISYSTAFFNDFVSDDRGVVINANDLNYGLSQPLTILRPVLNYIIYHMTGVSPFWYRLPNIFFHTGSAFLVFIIGAIIKNKFTGFIAASLFAVHPFLIEGVTWISGGVYAQYAFFVLLAFYFYLFSTKHNKFYIASIVAFCLALLSSEKAVPSVLIFFVYELCFGNFLKYWKKWTPFFVVSGVYTLLYLGNIGKRVDDLQEGGSFTPGMDNPLVQIPFAITNYLDLIFWPNALTLYHSELAISQGEYWIRFIAFLILVGFLLYSFLKKKQLFFWMTFFIIPLLPTLTPFRITWIVAERYAYLGTVGIFSLVALGFAKLREKKQLRPTLYTLLTIILFLLSIRTIIRNIDWKNEDNLWIATGKTSPSSPNTHNNLGDVYGRWGDLKKSEEEFKTAIKIKPDYADAWHNLGNVLRQQKRTDEALASYQKALSFNPRIWQSYVNIGAIYFEKEEYEKALISIDGAIKLLPNNPDLYMSKGIIYLKMGEKEKARGIFSLILQADPTNPKAQAGMAEVEKIK